MAQHRIVRMDGTPGRERGIHAKTGNLVGVSLAIAAALASGCASYSTLEDVYAKRADEIDAVALDTFGSIDDLDMFDATVSVDGDELTLSATAKGDVTDAEIASVQTSLQGDETVSAMGSVASSLQETCKEEGTDVEVTLVVSLLDASDDEIATATYTSEGIDGYEGREVELSLEDMPETNAKEAEERVLGVIAELGLDKDFDAKVSLKRNELGVSLTPTEGTSDARMAIATHTLRDLNAVESMRKVVKEVEAAGNENGIEAEATIVVSLLDASGAELFTATYASKGLGRYEGDGVEAELTLEDVWDESLFSDTREQIMRGLLSTAKSVENVNGFDVGTTFSTHGNELEFTMRLDRYANEIEPSSVRDELLLKPEIVAYSKAIANSLNTTFMLSYGSALEKGSITYRATVRDKEGNLIDTCLYSPTGIVEE